MSTRLLALSLCVLMATALAFGGCGGGDSDPGGGAGGTAGSGGSAGTGGSAGAGGDPGTEFRVGPEGGEHDHPTADGHVVGMRVPAGSLTEEVVITVAVTGAHDDDPYTIPGLVFDFGPDGTQFDPPLELTVTYDPNALDGAPEDALALYKRTGGDWDPIDSTVDTSANTVSAELDSFSIYGVLRSFPFPSGWQHPEGEDDFISLPGRSNERPVVAMDGRGAAIVAWTADDDTTNCINNTPCNRVFFSEFRSGFWKHPDDVADNVSPNGIPTGWLQAAMADNGDALIVYAGLEASRPTCDNMSCWQIYKSERRDDAWDHSTIQADYIGPQSDGSRLPAVAMDNSGNAIIAWEESLFGEGEEILMSEYRNGAWTHPDSFDDFISPGDGGEALGPKVAMDDDGNALIAWVQEEAVGDCGAVAGCQQAYLSEYRNGGWSHPADTDDHVSQDSDQGRDFKPFGMALDMSNDGTALLAFQHQVGADTNRPMFLSEYRSGTWDHPASGTDNVISLSGSEAYEPSLATNSNGDAVVAWVQGDGTTNCDGGQCQQVYISQYRNGSWSHPANRATDGIAPSTNPWDPAFADPTYTPRVAIDDDGDAIIVWTQPDDTDDCFQGCRRVYMSELRDGSWTHPSGPSDAVSRAGVNASYASVAMSNNGSAVVAWQTWTAGGQYLQIYMSQYFP